VRSREGFDAENERLEGRDRFKQSMLAAFVSEQTCKCHCQCGLALYYGPFARRSG
jgi:hypothetical protein